MRNRPTASGGGTERVEPMTRNAGCGREHDHGHGHVHGDGCCGGGAVSPAGTVTDTSSDRVRMVFTVRGLDCAEEVAALKKAVGPLVGGEEHLAFDVLEGRMLVLRSAAEVPAEEIRKAVARTGMTAELYEEGATDGERRARRNQLAFTVASGVAWIAGIVYHVVDAGGLGAGLRLFAGHGAENLPLAEVLLYAAAIAFGIRYVVVKAWFAARSLRPDMNLLMVVAVSGAIVIGEWFEGAAVTFLFALSLALESWSVDRARRAIAALLDLAPPVARLRGEDGGEREVPVADVAVGSRILVLPGERIPLDGEVASGTGAVDQAPITGESVPVTKQPGDAVYAGSINTEGVLEIVTTKAASDTMLARIIRMVREAQSRRAAVEQWVERFARIYTPAVILLAILIFLLPPLLAGGAWDLWFYRALVLLVIACPCALVISTPVSVVSAIASSARHGVLIKGGGYLEQAARLRAIAFDKTGTLTRGEPAVVAIETAEGIEERRLLAVAAALEARSLHPLARAILAEAERRGVAFEPATEVRNLPGKGVEGRLDGTSLWLGSTRWIAERDIDIGTLAGPVEELKRAGRTVVLLGRDDRLLGVIGIADTIRPEAPAAVAALRDLGIEHLVMLTGDNRVTAAAIARELGITEIRAELLPEDKVRVIEELTERYRTVAMVGDGVNDAPAMARASFGIAMGAAGSDVAIETADIALMTDRLDRVPWLVGHGRRMLAVIHQNIAFSLGVKALFVLLAMIGYATLWGAIAADVGATLVVVANALRLLGGRPREIAPGTATAAATESRIAA